MINTYEHTSQPRVVSDIKLETVTTEKGVQWELDRDKSALKKSEHSKCSWKLPVVVVAISLTVSAILCIVTGAVVYTLAHAAEEEFNTSTDETLSWSVSIPGVRTTEKYNQSTIMDTDGNYILFWNFNETHITFEVHVRTKGWVGFGLSGNGNMYPGDVIVGWVTGDGHTYFADRHTNGHTMPIKDQYQDWDLLFAEENEFGTVLKFVRRIDTCDSAEDKVIEEGTVRLIYAYSQQDPDNSIMYHGTTRGTKSVSLLSSSSVPASMPSDMRHFDFLNDNYLLDSAYDTIYWCRSFQLHDIGKHHMIKFEPIISPGHEHLVHHIVIYRCKGVSTAADGVTGHCYNGRPKQLPTCSDIILAWAIGGEAFYFPEDVGFSFGGPDDASVYVMETHFDNPPKTAGLIDNSGIRVTLTQTLRPQEAGLLEVGRIVNHLLIVPPYQESFVSKGYCGETCLTQAFVQSNLTEIKVIGAFQHAHLLGAGIKTRHFRNRTELKPLMEDPNYDFNFQETRLLPKEVSVFPGDSLSVECTYDSSGRTVPTFGGLSTKDEMCLTFLYYYPKMTMANCLSSPMYENNPQDIAATDWTNKTIVTDFIAKTDSAMVYNVCRGDHFKAPVQGLAFSATEPQHPYVPPSPICS